MARRSYTPDEKADALAAYVEHGPREAAAITGIPSSTIQSWAKAAGLRTKRNERTAAAVDAIKLSAEERKARLADDLLRIAEMAVGLEVAKMPAADLRDIVGARTRAIHDAQLLTGNATSRTEVNHVDAVDAEIAALTALLAANDPQPVDA